MNIEIPSREVTRRIPSVRRFLKPLVERPADLYVLPKSSAEEFVVSAHGKGFSNSGTFNTFRFRTVVPNFYAMYYERWKRHYIGKNEYYYLYQAYLHLYHIDRVNGETEFLLLHCDPNEPKAAAHAIYKQSLHLHIESINAAWPHDIWPHSHIALNVAYLNTMLTNIESLTHAMEVAIVMLKEEVLDLLK